MVGNFMDLVRYSNSIVAVPCFGFREQSSMERSNGLHMLTCLILLIVSVRTHLDAAGLPGQPGVSVNWRPHGAVKWVLC